MFLNKFNQQFAEKPIGSLTSEDTLNFLTENSESQKQSTKRLNYTFLKYFFNFTIVTSDLNISNPTEAPVFKKLFRAAKGRPGTILEKDVVDEVIFKTEKPRNRLMMELMARGGMRVGEVLKLAMNDIHDQKLTLRDPKSGREYEYVFIPVKVAERLREYAKSVCENPDDRIFPISYETARIMVIKAGQTVGIHLRPHDLRRHSATFASRSGVPIEIVSKIILRHSNLSTTQRYLGKITDTEAMKWIENLYN